MTPEIKLIIIQHILGHSDRVSGVVWHPQATLSQSPDAVNLASGAADNSIKLWNLSRSDVFQASDCSGADSYSIATSQ